VGHLACKNLSLSFCRFGFKVTLNLNVCFAVIKFERSYLCFVFVYFRVILSFII